MKMKMWVLVAVTVLFLASMAALTFTARDIREARLPKVTAKRLTRESFPLREGSNITSKRVAIPKAMFDEGGVYIVANRIVNGEPRDFAQKIYIETGLEIEDFYEVTRGIMGHEFLIIDSDRPFGDWDEVLVVTG